MNSTQEFILQSIRAHKPEGNYAYPEFPEFPKSSTPLLEEFKTNLVAGAGTWHEVADARAASTCLHDLFPSAKVVCSAAPEIKGNRALSQRTDPHALEDVDVGVIRASFGVSETGMVWLTEENMQMTALGFLSQHLVILLDPAQLVRDMYEAYARVNLFESQYGCFMLGPSATADIGAYMVRGAQGARSLTVFFLSE